MDKNTENDMLNNFDIDSLTNVDQTKFYNLFDYLDSERRSFVLAMFDFIWDKFKLCPASTKYHGSYEGGLKDHTYLVTCQSILLYKWLSKISKEVTNKCSLSSIVLCSLVHDLGKLGNVSGIPYYVIDNTSTNVSGKRIYKYNLALANIEHELRTIEWLMHFNIELIDKEIAAIYHHAGSYNESYKYIQPDSMHPLIIIIHSADNLIAKIFNI